MRGAPQGRIGGGPRHIGRAFTIAALVPDHVGLTTRAQPVLYWYAAQPVTQPLEFTLIEEEAVEPLVEAPLSPPDQPGIASIRLADYAISLEPGRRYQWFIALILDRNNRSRDILAGGMIERVDPSAELLKKLDGTRIDQRPAIYAEEGIWYDALRVVSDSLGQKSKKRMSSDQRAALLEQVGLGAIIKKDLPRASFYGQ